MIVYNVTKLEKEDALINMLKEARIQHIYKFITALIVVLCGAGILIYGYVDKNLIYKITGYLFLGIGLLMLLHAIYTFIKLPKAIIKANPEICENGGEYSFTFKEQSFQVVINSLSKKMKYNYKYSDIKKILEYDDKYILKLTDNYVLYVFKNGFDSSKSEEFFKRNLSINKKKIKDKRKKS